MARLMDVVSYDEAGADAVNAATLAATELPGDGWLQRIAEGIPSGPLESLLLAVRGHVYARATAQEAGFGIETELAEPTAPSSHPPPPPPRRSSGCCAPWWRSGNGSRRCWKTRPTGSTPPRGRGSKARSADCPGAPRPSPPGSRW
jgi:hypothetical protein